jgi:hypothetical protein
MTNESRTEELRAMLAELRQQLEHPSALTDEQKDALRNSANEIERLLNKQNLKREEATKTGGQLRERVTHFEAEHPDLTILIGRMADALSKIGI